MKPVLYIALFLLSALSFAQSTGSISGNVLDFESDNAPLMLAKVTIKETGEKVLADENGFFKFENLKDGEYTLVSSFIGYDTKTLKIKVAADAKKTEFVLEPSTLSLDDFILTMASADNTKTTSVK